MKIKLKTASSATPIPLTSPQVADLKTLLFREGHQDAFFEALQRLNVSNVFPGKPRRVMEEEYLDFLDDMNPDDITINGYSSKINIRHFVRSDSDFNYNLNFYVIDSGHFEYNGNFHAMDHDTMEEREEPLRDALAEALKAENGWSDNQRADFRLWLDENAQNMLLSLNAAISKAELKQLLLAEKDVSRQDGRVRKI